MTINISLFHPLLGPKSSLHRNVEDIENITMQMNLQMWINHIPT